jgi:hypothetical protein
MKTFRTLLLTVLFAATSPGIFCQSTTWLSPLYFQPTDQNVSIIQSSPNTAVAVQSAIVGDFQWITMGLNLRSDQLIDSIIVCYQLTNSASYISQVRLTSMTTPDAAYIIVDDPTDLTSTSPTRYASFTFGLSVDGTITLAFRLNFAATQDIIEIGAIGIVSSDVVNSSYETPGIGLSTDFKLNQNYPNPFNPSTTISYTVSGSENIRINIYDSNGALIRNLLNEEQSTGNYSVIWNGTDNNGLKISSGTYFYQVIAGEFTEAKKMILLK